MLDEKAIALAAAIRKAKNEAQEHVEMLHDQSFQLRLQADMNDAIAAHLVREANEHLPVLKPDLHFKPNLG